MLIVCTRWISAFADMSENQILCFLQASECDDRDKKFQILGTR